MQSNIVLRLARIQILSLFEDVDIKIQAFELVILKIPCFCLSLKPWAVVQGLEFLNSNEFLSGLTFKNLGT